MNYTSIEQSKALIEAGLNPETADMYYREWKRATKLISIAHVGKYGKDDMPCWSTGALINILPSEIHIGETKDFIFQLRLGKTKTEFWISYEFQISDSRGTFITFKADKGTYICFNTAIDKCDMADCVYKMVMFCLEKGFIKKEEPCE